MTVIISGANGYIGKAFLARIREISQRKITALVRSDNAKTELASEFEGLDIRVVDYSDPKCVDSALSDDAHLFHLVGTIRETRRFSFRTIHEDLCNTIVNAPTKLSKITSLSVVGASLQSNNPCLRSRANADQIFDTSGVSTAIVRIPMVLGGDGHASKALRKNIRKRFVFSFRASSLEQPIFLDDVIDLLCETLKDGSPEGVFNLGGPASLTRRELIKIAGRSEGMNPILISLPLLSGYLLSWLLEKFQDEPVISRATLGVLDHDDDVDNSYTLRAFGLSLTSLRVMLSKVLREPIPQSKSDSTSSAS